MNEKFLIHNYHRESIDQFTKHDPNLRRLANQPYQYRPSLLEKLPIDMPGVYSLGGGRQVGKTTLLKQCMLELMLQGTNPNSIIFLSGELIEHFNELYNLIDQSIKAINTSDKIKFLLIDEITYIQHWDRAVKYAADAGLLDDIILMLTGSDLTMMQSARMTFPGRRGRADTTDFHLYPLSFRESVQLTNTHLIETEKSGKPTDDTLTTLSQCFNQYMIHGGYLTAINDLAKDNTILPATLHTYSDWVRGDMLKQKKQECYLHEIIEAIFNHYGSQISWNSLAKNLSIDHPKTVSEYIELLEKMDALFVQNAIAEDRNTAAPKKAKKVMFNDPFIYHALFAWIYPSQNPYENQILTSINTPELSSKLAEAIAITHYKRFYPTYYIKSEGEVDIAYVNENKAWPIEIKWTEQLRPKTLKQLSKYQNSLVLTKTPYFKKFDNGIESEPLTWHLYNALPNE